MDTEVEPIGPAIGFSSFGVLTCYAIANASAWTQDDAHRRWPRSLTLAGLMGCVVLVAALPLEAAAAGASVLAGGCRKDALESVVPARVIQVMKRATSRRPRRGLARSSG